MVTTGKHTSSARLTALVWLIALSSLQVGIQGFFASHWRPHLKSLPFRNFKNNGSARHHKLMQMDKGANEVQRLKSSKVAPRSFYAGSLLTGTRFFRRLAEKAYGKIRVQSNGEVNIDNFYAAVLLIHLDLAKYAGPSACYPPSHDTVEQLFATGDPDGSGHLNLDEFVDLARICCSQIMSRMLVYYTIMIVLLPVLGHLLVDLILGLSVYLDGIVANAWLRQVGSRIADAVPILQSKGYPLLYLLLSFGIIPALFTAVDNYYRNAAEEREREKLT